MKKKENSIKVFKQNRAITLVALVVTIVIMLILAGVAIAAVVGGDGLFNRVKQATETYENAADREKDMLQNLMGQVDYYLEENKGDGEESVDEVPIENPINQIVNVNQTYAGGATGSYSDPIIPKGFAPINENGATWGSEDGYQKGLIITDEVDGDGNSIGNEYVWVPVDDSNVTFGRQNWRNSDDKLLTFPENITIGEDISTQYTETVPSEIITSVTTNGGFYIARFEAGKPEGVTLATDGSIKPLSKQGATVWNSISWSESNNKDDTNPGNGAVTVARSIYPAGNTNYGAISTLIYGTQWDTVLKFIEAYSGDIGYATNSNGKGNYSGENGADDIASMSEPAECGAREGFRQKNIYDIAGNVYEWTMEKYSEYCCRRGGYYGDTSGAVAPASYRTQGDVDGGDTGTRFSSCTLYKINII